jgi:hypothetical protein
MSAVNKANKVLGYRFITKYGTKQGVLVLSKQIPFGLGIAVGASSSYTLAGQSLEPRGRSSGPRRSSLSLGRPPLWLAPKRVQAA